MDFRMLGPLEVVEGDQRLPLGGGRQRHVLAALLARRGSVIGSEALIEEVWGDRPPVSVVTSLQIAVSKLRKVLGPERIETRPNGYELVVEERDIDAGRFERWIEDGRALLSRGDGVMGGQLLQQGLALWRGQVLADIDGGELINGERARLEEFRLAVLEDSMDARSGRGQHVELVPELTALVAAHPYRERLHGQLILALYRGGRQTDALSAYTKVRRMLVDDLGVEPSADLVALESRILRQDPELNGPPTRSSLKLVPTASTDLIGREPELQDLHKLVSGGARLVTVTGPGGVGKTRLMLALAHRLAADASDVRDIVFVDFSPLTDAELVLPTLANALGIAERGDRPLLDNLADTLEFRDLFLLLDNCEKAIGAAPALSSIVARCPGLRVVATSRERLALRDEQEFALAPLALPDPSTTDVIDIATCPAVRLFCERARAVQRDFTLTDRNAAAVAELCRRLDGLPLALELAAARAKLLSPAALVARLNSDRKSVLSGGARDLPERHRALDTTIAWSYDALSPQEQRVLQTCSVFAGGAAVETLETVCDRIPGDDMLDIISSLLDKSLLVRHSDEDETPRITMLETIRAYAVDRLTHSGELPATRERHAAAYAQIAAAAGIGLWDDHDTWMARLDADVDNIRAALDWSLSQGSQDVAAAILADLGRYWAYRGAYAEGSGWLGRAATGTQENTRAGAAVRALLADIEMRQGNLNGWVQHLPDALRQLQSVGDTIGYASGTACHSDVLWQQGHYDDAIAAAETAVSVAREIDLPLLRCFTSALLGVSLAEHGQPHLGMRMLTEAAALIPPGKAEYFSMTIRVNLGWVQIQNHFYEEARDQLLSALKTGAIADRHVYMQAHFRTNLGWAMLALGQAAEAASSFLQAIRLEYRSGDAGLVGEGLAGLGCAAANLHQESLAGRAFALVAQQLKLTGIGLSPYVAERLSECDAALVSTPAPENIGRIKDTDLLSLLAEVDSTLQTQDQP